MTARRLETPKTARRVTIKHDGKSYEALEGEPLAAALMAAGVSVLGRSMKYHRPRGAPCGTGDCASCLVDVDGLPNRCACTTPCRDGMASRSQNVLGSAKNDLLGITDWMFPWGLDHHEMFTGVPLVQPVVQKVVHKLSGLGELASGGRLSAEQPPEPARRVDVLVVGGGPSGIAAAEEARRAGAEVLLVEARDRLGGRLLGGLHGDPEQAEEASRRLAGAGVEVWLDSAAVQLDRHAAPLEVLILRADRLSPILPRAIVFCCGGYGATGIFENNDLPGIVTAEWAGRLITRWSVLPGERPVVCADEPAAGAVTRLLTEAGAAPVRVLPLAAAYAEVWPGPVPERLVSARGGKHVEKVIVETDEGRESVSCDLVVVASPPAPAFELALDAGAEVAFEPSSGGFAVRSDAEGVTRAPDVLVAGSLMGPCSAEEARLRGEAAGRAAAREAARDVTTTEGRHAS